MDLPIPELTERYREIMALRPELLDKVLHIPVRLTDQDRELSPIEWGEIAQGFIVGHKLEDAPWMAWIHREPPRGEGHLHIVALNTTFAGERIDLGGNYITNQKVAAALELQLGLWRAPRRRGGEVLPPVTSEAPAALPAPGKVALSRDLIRSLIRPGMSLPQLRDELAKHQVDLVPKFAKDGVTITGLGFKFDGTFVKASEVDRGFSLKGLAKSGVTYEPARDLAALAPPVPALVVNIEPPPVPDLEHPLPAPLPTLAHLPPRLKYEVPHVERPTPKQTLFQRFREFALGLWRPTPPRIVPPANLPSPGKLWLGK